ncbi:hypothetical protein TELCIR_23826 [Teladorsagia circumcincta]|uniref:BPTI/Kunitz inhibitor domain-containing protein n=1 Tax=Teladorsagia circumcincta TaxID=45464 RepID=A0A2G9T9Z0_TELCI|nr:hypothetical protein TELCIR_23826 [Teladorsagia circumcincta]
MYSGCGGNANNFESSDRCHHSCGFEKVENFDCGNKKVIKVSFYQ